jgi:hypothetical protein
MAKTGTHDDGYICPDGEDFFRKVDARHLGHGLIGNDKIELGLA